MAPFSLMRPLADRSRRSGRPGGTNRSYLEQVPHRWPVGAALRSEPRGTGRARCLAGAVAVVWCDGCGVRSLFPVIEPRIHRRRCPGWIPAKGVCVPIPPDRAEVSSGPWSEQSPSLSKSRTWPRRCSAVTASLARRCCARRAANDNDGSAMLSPQQRRANDAVPPGPANDNNESLMLLQPPPGHQPQQAGSGDSLTYVATMSPTVTVA